MRGSSSHEATATISPCLPEPACSTTAFHPCSVVELDLGYPCAWPSEAPRAPPGGTRVYNPSTHASPCSGVPFPVAKLNAFILILCRLSLLLTIMGTLLVITLPGRNTRISLYSVTGLATWFTEGGFLHSLFGWGYFPSCFSPSDYVINYWIFGVPPTVTAPLIVRSTAQTRPHRVNLSIVLPNPE